ncbi:MAG TPA: hypothetical protein DCQ94_03315 [Nitrospira sp.]|nr:hypothetical protein [Nitrospira sp.]
MRGPPALVTCRLAYGTVEMLSPCPFSDILAPMLELLIVLGSLVLIGLTGLLTVVVTPPLMVEFGIWVLAAGLLMGIPAGWWYHVMLYRTLAARMPVPPQWWRRPVDLHPLLTLSEYRRMRPWFVAGAVGFILCVIGGVAAIAGMLVLRFSP